MSSLVAYSNFLLTRDVKRTFEENYLKMLFEKHKDLPKSDIIEFIHKAQQTGANPSLNQIFLIERVTKINNTWQKVGAVVFSYNFILAVANQTGEFDGYTMQTEIKEKFCPTSSEVKKVLCSTCVVKRNGREFPYSAWFDEYVQTKRDETTQRPIPTGTWAQKPYLMLEKCALAGALRRAFPEALSGMYCQEEMTVAEDEFNREATEATLVQKAVEVVEKREEKMKEAEIKNDKITKIEAIKIALSELTRNQSPLEKMNALFEFCGGATKISDLETRSLSELDEYLAKIKLTLEEKTLRETRNKKPTLNSLIFDN